ncbi:MAG: SDR family oxidoreductase [Nitrospinae bacterium]|nr:SDR family oxidoreductase [Nitrospinota bacterium]
MDNHRKTVLITGAAKRLGRATSLAFAKAGYCVAIHYSSSETEAIALKDEIETASGKGAAAIFKAQLSREDEIGALPRRVADTFGRLDVVVNNASVFAKTPIAQITGESFDRFNAIHIKAPALLSLAAAELLRKSKPGRIINMVDVYADFTKKDFTPYAVSKAGLKSLTRQLAVELAPDILVNAVAPGAIMEPVGGESPEVIERILARIPLRRFGDPEDIARTVLFLAQADYITGHTIVVDGGRSLTI